MKIASLFIALAITTASFAQQASVKRFTAPLAGSAVLSEVEDKYQAEVFSLEAPAPDGNVDKVLLRSAKAAVEKQFPRQKFTSANKTTAVNPPLVAFSYLADSANGIPPDNDLAISKGNRTVSVVNTSIATHDALTGVRNTRKTLYSFSLSVGLNNSQFNQNNNRFDPKVVYDPQADRFICIILNGVNGYSHVIVGFSQTNNPDGAWSFYKFKGDFKNDTTWFDYPGVAITNDELFITGNQIRYSTSWQAGFKQTVVYQIRKSDGYQGSALLNYQMWENIGFDGRNLRNLFPVKGGSSVVGPEQYFLSNRNFDVQNDSIFLVKIPDTIGSTNNNVTVTPLVANIKYGVPPNGRQNDSFVLATNDGRILGAYREGSDIQFVSTSVHPVSGSASVYHGTVSSFNSTPTVSASIFSVDSLDFGYPNISFAGNYGGQNHSIISFNFTGPQTHPGMGAIYHDGTQHSDMIVVKSGDTSIKVLNSKEQRWGDYMGSQIDWNAPGTVWVEGIYGRSDRQYGSWIAKLVSPFYSASVGTIPVPPTSNLYPNPGISFIRLEFQLAKASGVNFSIFDMQGRKVDELLSHQCRQGKNLIQFNIASLATGTYVLRGTDVQGKDVMSRRFVKQ